MGVLIAHISIIGLVNQCSGLLCAVRSSEVCENLDPYLHRCHENLKTWYTKMSNEDLFESIWKRYGSLVTHALNKLKAELENLLRASKDYEQDFKRKIETVEGSFLPPSVSRTLSVIDNWETKTKASPLQDSLPDSALQNFNLMTAAFATASTLDVHRLLRKVDDGIVRLDYARYEIIAHNEIYHKRLNKTIKKANRKLRWLKSRDLIKSIPSRLAQLSTKNGGTEPDQLNTCSKEANTESFSQSDIDKLLPFRSGK